jgi:integrase
MKPRSKPIPSYRLHKQSGQAVVTLPDTLGRRRDVLLGKHGTEESKAEYLRVLNEWRASGSRLPSVAGPGLSINELILAYFRHAEQIFGEKRPGETAGTLDNIRNAMKPLKELYGHTPSSTFGPRALKAIQQHLAESGLCRNTINRRVGRIKTMFRWAESEELITPSTCHALSTVRGLEKGRSPARETAAVQPVHPDTVEATLPLLLPMVRDMIQLQLLCGCRPGELVVMRPIDIDTTGQVWQYRPGSDAGPEGRHKTAHHGHTRIILLGPRAIEIVRRRLVPNVTDYLFSPARALAEWNAARRVARKTRVQPSQQFRRRKRPKTKAGERYTTGTYRQAIERACKRAGIATWSPNQLRHAKATEIRRVAGLDTVAAVLGHRSVKTSEIYALQDLAKAEKIMSAIG